MAKMALKLTFEGLKYPQKARVEDKKCSSMCGTTVQAISDLKNLTGLAGGVREDQNVHQKWPTFG